MDREKTISSKVIYDGRAVKLRVDAIKMLDGRETTREIVEHADCIAVVAVDEKDNVLLVRQYRTPIGKELLEIPAGGIDEGEKPEEAVRREMQEETGFLPGKWSGWVVFTRRPDSVPNTCTFTWRLILCPAASLRKIPKASA